VGYEGPCGDEVGWNGGWARVVAYRIKEKVPKYFGTLIFSA